MNDRIRVAHVVFSLEPGGMENGVVNLANGLPADRFSTKIFCLENEGAFAGRLDSSVEIESFGRRQGFDLRSGRKLAKALRDWDAQILHTHNLGPLIYGLVSRILAFPHRMALLHGEHGALQGDDLRPKRLLQRRLAYRFVDEVHTVSGTLKNDLVDHGLGFRSIVPILNGVDCLKFRPPGNKGQAKERLGFGADELVIGMVGRFLPSKRHDLVLEAFASWARAGSSRLLILGDKGEAKEATLRAIETHPHASRIQWLGHRDDLLPYYQAMDCQAMPSSSEGLSNALLEGMACGVPSIAHPACGAVEVIEDGENGRLVPITAGRHLEVVLEEFWQDRERLGTLSAGARRTAEERFSLEAMIENYSSLYRRLVAG